MKTMYLHESFVVENKINQGNKCVLTESTGSYLVPKIEAIHAGKTKNNVIYPSQSLAGDIELKSGVYSWTHPYPKPMLKNHDTDVEPLGRVVNAQFVSDSVTGKNAVVVMPAITDRDAIEKILDGRYLTVSIGSETDAAICNICGADILEEGWCGHERGQKYEVDNQLVECSWTVGNIWFHELSFVNVPADQEAQVISTGELINMECFAVNNNIVTDLQKERNSSGYILTNESAQLQGIVVENSKSKNKEPIGGTTGVKTLEQVQKELEDKETKLQEAVDKLTETNTKLTECETQISQLTEKVKSLEESNTALNEKSQELEAKLGEAEGKLATSEAENKKLLEENADMSAKIHQSLVERVVDMKVYLGKPGSDNRESLVTEHAERSPESLRDALVDLIKEFNSIPAGSFIAEKVDNPAANRRRSQQKNDKLYGSDKKDLTLGDIYYDLLGNK